VFVQAQGLRSSEEYDAAEHVPLDFQQTVRAVANEIADDSISRAYEAGQQHEPF
jgi:hypothetical protein